MVFVTLTSSAVPGATATDLGHLLHKHPDRAHIFDLPVGTAHVFYPEATENRCTVALLVEVDPIGLVRNKRFGGDAFALSQYVNDRPYAASSMLAVALGKVFGTAMKGRCPSRPELVDRALTLTVRLPSLPSDGGAELVERLFTPLGWRVDARPVALDPQVPRWGDSRYLDVSLTGSLLLHEALSHLYVLLPVLDGAKHYWVSTDEVDKLVRAGSGWLGGHPERDLVTRRYLAHQRTYVVDATERLAALDDTPEHSSDPALDPVSVVTQSNQPVRAVPARPLAEARRHAVVSALKEVGAHRAVDVGCGEGALLRDLLADPFFTEVVGVDVSARALERAERRLNLDRMPDSQRDKLTLRQSSVTYRDAAIAGFDALVLMEVIEHVDLGRVPSLERSVFRDARPANVVVTTPNVDYNVLYDHLPAGELRHPDHRFEWSRADFGAWASTVGEAYGYAVEVRPIGPVDPVHGAPTQLALFRRLTGGGA